VGRRTDRHRGAGRKLQKEVVVHTHFNHPDEITTITRAATSKLFDRGITVRNQTVLIRGVNDAPAVMGVLVKRLSFINVHPYYIYVHDMVKGVEDLRTTVESGAQLEKQLRGLTAGYNTPTTVVDTPGGGKRDVHSYEHYDRETGSRSTARRWYTRGGIFATSIPSTCCRPRGKPAGPIRRNTTAWSQRLWKGRESGDEFRRRTRARLGLAGSGR